MPVVKFYGINENERILDIVKNLFQKMGYRIHSHEHMDWDILWSHTYPFYTLAKEMVLLKPNQKVNHFPGSGFITQKSNLATLSINHIPKSFALPQDKKTFLEYVEKNPIKFWILKSSTHRGMKLMNGTEDLDSPGSYVQEFIKKPLLINGKKFDVGVYVILTSIDPLRVYMYSGDILLRFCKEKYFPLNINLPESYIVGDDYLPVWEVPDLKFYYSELNYTAKESLNQYLESKGKSTKRIWYQINETIKDVYLQTESDLKKSTMSLGSLRNFFELVRFDFIIDEDLNVFLLEVNMSPNLSAAHFPENKLLYEQIVYNSLSIVGIIRKFHDSFTYRGEAEVSEKDIQVFAEQCASETCQLSCKKLKCRICNHCMNKEMREISKQAYLEFLNRGKYRRILPSPNMLPTHYYVKDKESSYMNEFMDLWFKGKCHQDPSWCY
ncbi:tubulin polyglutamylase TTLL4 [Nephila pilipes]|uniref:Tubulin polyglutamylase TTLL4 n=1 Tax=Nephila pilipes TaxID=299642 RepID=A0A8X6PXU2_NEPPI|nr:tubulin polyglutamylase TTLL4 [Nephila pilipes]